MRMIIAGVFDAFPKLQIILGHYAEGLPFMFDRVDRPYLQGHVRPDPARGADAQAHAQRVPARQLPGLHQRQLLPGRPSPAPRRPWARAGWSSAATTRSRT